MRQYSILKILSVVVVCFYLFLNLGPNAKGAASDEKFYYVTRAIDGDTLELSRSQRVRLIGLDTPEFHYSKKLLRDARRAKRDVAVIQELGRQAKEFTKKICSGKRVRLEFDIEKKDKYGRLLAYVYLEDGTFLNAKILEEGYAQVLTVPPNVRYVDYFLKLQDEARKKNRGLWQGL